MLLDPSMENVFSTTMGSEATSAITLNPHMKAKMMVSIVHSNGGTGVRYPPEESISKQKHVQITQSYRKPVLCPFSFHHNGSHTNSTRICAHGQQLYVTQQGPYPKYTHTHISDRPKNRYRLWISCRSAYVGLHQFSLQVKLSPGVASPTHK